MDGDTALHLGSRKMGHKEDTGGATDRESKAAVPGNSFYTLPAELRNEVAQFLTQKDCYNLALVNQELLKTANYWLYRDVELKTNRSTLLYTSLICQDGEVAKNVHTLSLWSNPTEEHVREGPRSSPVFVADSTGAVVSLHKFVELAQLFANSPTGTTYGHVPHSDFRSLRAWPSALVQDVKDARATLVLLMVKDLKVLKLGAFSWRWSRWINAAAALAIAPDTPGGPRLQKLYRLELHGSDIDTTDQSPWFQLRALRQLKIKGAICLDGPYYPSRVLLGVLRRPTVAFPLLENLTFNLPCWVSRSFGMGKSVFPDDNISSRTGLKVLEITYALRFWLLAKQFSVIIGALLSSNTTSLTRLHLKYKPKDDYYEARGIGRSANLTDALQQLECVEELRIDSIDLLGYGMSKVNLPSYLPPSLAVFTLVLSDEQPPDTHAKMTTFHTRMVNLASELKKLLKACRKGSFAQLKTVTILGYSKFVSDVVLHDIKWARKMEDEFKTICEGDLGLCALFGQEGVKLKIEGVWYFEGVWYWKQVLEEYSQTEAARLKKSKLKSVVGRS